VEGSLTSAALRNQGAAGVVDAAREHCTAMDCSGFVVDKEDLFNLHLDSQTIELQDKFPTCAKNWGAARKAINIVLREYLYNKYLCCFYKLDKIESWLEVPLDKNVYDGMSREYETELEAWPSIKHLTPELSNRYQSIASELALKKYNKCRVHLDLKYWRPVQ